MKLRVFMSVLALGACVGMAEAQMAYAVDASANLYLVNLGTNSASLVGNTGVFLEGLAMNSSGQMFGTDTSGNLYSINANTGASTLVGASGLFDPEGLDFADSDLWATNFDAPTTLHQLDTSTGADTGNDVTSTITDSVARAMTFDPANDYAWTLNDTAFGQDLWKTTYGGVSTLVGALADPTGEPLSQTAAMEFDSSGNLWALGESGQVWSINPNTAVATLMGNTGGQVYLDMTMAVPEPATMIPLGLGALALVIRRRKK